MKAIKPRHLIFGSAAFLFWGCAASPAMPELTPAHPASAEAREGSVVIPAVTLMERSVQSEIPSNGASEKHQGTGHDTHSVENRSHSEDGHKAMKTEDE